MQDILSFLHCLHRPQLLVKAARFGSRDYRRTRHLPRLLGSQTLPKPAVALLRLSELESGMDDRRKAKDATYSVARHIEILIAIMGEVQHMRDTVAERHAARALR